MQLKQSIIIAFALSIICVSVWELYWRSQGYYPDFDNDDALWANQRDRVNTASKDDIILIGSSRIHFDVQLDIWEENTGIRPIQLAHPGSSPIPVFNDLANKTDFHGTIVVGVTPGLFFSGTTTDVRPYRSSNNKVEYFYNQTYAQRLNHKLSIPFQKYFAFISDADGISGIKLKAVLNKISIGNRIEEGFPPFPKFADISFDRNLRMIEKTVIDTSFANMIKKVWSYKSTDTTPPKHIDKKGVMQLFKKDAKTFMDRGGKLILLRCPSTGYYERKETNFYKKEAFWDSLLIVTGAKGYHFIDYEQLNKLDCPEWSHLSGEDADYFTNEITKIMINDQTIPTSKTK
jgi:hypothetical protein